MHDDHRPRLGLLSPEQVELTLREAYRVLEEVGVVVENDDAMDLLSGAGARVSDDGSRVVIPREVCERCVASAPDSFSLYNRGGNEAMRIGGDDAHFVPGSAATRVYDLADGSIRAATTRDVVEFAAVTNVLTSIDVQSTCVVPGDVPESIADRYRLFLALVHGEKPAVTGTFTKDAFATMHAFLTAVRGGTEALRDKPLAVFDCCPTSPLTWSDLTCQALVDCARHGVPAELVPAPLIGATSPVTLAGTVVQHTAENLSGIVIHQCAARGAPLVYGGAATLFDMRRGTAPMSAVEAVMVSAACAQVGKFLGLPVHAYMGLSDAKVPGAQSGFETTLGAMTAALAGVNVVSGAGLLNYVNCQSLEKLVFDDEVCAHARRLVRGIERRDDDLGVDAIRECAVSGSFLTSPHTRRHFRDEVYYPGAVIDRLSQGDWEAAGRTTATDRARERVRDILASPDPSPLDAATLNELEGLMAADASRSGVDRLPEWRHS